MSNNIDKMIMDEEFSRFYQINRRESGYFTASEDLILRIPFKDAEFIMEVLREYMLKDKEAKIVC